MKRILALAVLGLALIAGSASANGVPPGNIALNGRAGVGWGPPGGYGGYGGGYGYGQVQPYQLGPWYQYWPYEAHFQYPALPQYPYWGAQGLPGGLPYIQPGMPGQGQAPPYWGGGH
jgi:hypothetical protein